MKINDDVIKAREIVSAYQGFNKETIETVKEYNPKLKIWTFIKKEIDPNAIEFKKKFCKAPKKEAKPKYNKPPKEKPVKLKKEKVIKPKKPRYIAKIKNDNDSFIHGSLIYQAYQYHLDGKSNKEISGLLNRNSRYVASMIRTRKIQLGLSTERKFESREKIVELIEQGLSSKEISEKLNLSENNVAYHTRRYNESKPKDQLELEYKEILFHMKKKAKLHQVNYCCSNWINKNKCKMKFNLNSLERTRRCQDLVEQGRLIEVPEKYTKTQGRVYLIPGL